MKDATIQELMEEVKGFGKAAEVEVYFKHPAAVEGSELAVPYPKAEGYKGIFNSKFGELCDIVSARYLTVNNEDAFMPVLGILNDAGHGSVKYKAYETAGYARVSVFFPEVKFTPKDGHDVIFGLDLWNSYDRSSSLFIGGYACRLICQNQMRLNNLIGSVSVKHTGKMEKLKDTVISFLARLNTRLDPVLAAVNQASEQEIAEGELEPLLETFHIRKKEKTAVEGLLAHEEGSMWGLYNAMTNYASNSVKSSDRGYELLNRAERLLQTPKEELVKEGREMLAMKATAKGA